MARKRMAYPALDDDSDRAYALSVAAAMAASEEETVHTPSVRKKKKPTPPAARGLSNGRPKTPPPPRPSASPAKAPRPNPSHAPVRNPVKKEKKIKYEAAVPVAQVHAHTEYEEESDEVSVDYQDLPGEEQEDHDDDEEEEEEDEEIAAPVVFQCATCRSIFGDSYAFICSNAELLLVTLSAVTNIALSPEPHTSRDGADRGSSFHELLCKQCQTVLGRQYLTTPPALDAIRSLYSFSTTAIASYQLGYPQLHQVETGASDTLPSLREIKQANQTCDEAVRGLSLDRQALLLLRDEMTKVQSLLVVVDERLHQLETQHDDSEQEEGDGDGDGDEGEHSTTSQPQQIASTPRRPAVASHRNRPF